MVNVHIGDDVLRNMLIRLPGKPLLRFRCVSKRWNRLISDPYFMKSRSRRMILFPYARPLAVIDQNEDQSVRIPFPIETQKDLQIIIIGTFNGVVVLALVHESFSCQLVLYNPLTCASKVLVSMDPPSVWSSNKFWYVFGFCHGETTHDLKIVRFELLQNLMYKWDVFDLKTNSWSTPPQYIKRDFSFTGDVGVFVNGFLYWPTSYRLTILALNVKEMVVSKVKLPDGVKQRMLIMGSIGGSLCVIAGSCNRFDVWIMKEQCDESSWTKAHSFAFAFAVDGPFVVPYYPICILGDGRILLTCMMFELVIYDTTKDSYKTLNCLKCPSDHKLLYMVYAFRMLDISFEWKDIRTIEYVESLVSPSDICFT